MTVIAVFTFFLDGSLKNYYFYTRIINISNKVSNNFIYLEENMKFKFGMICLLFCSILVFACVSKPSSNSSSNIKFMISLDSSISSPFVKSAWLSYTSDIQADMKKFYAGNPENEYIIPYNIEVSARNSLIDFYLRVQKEYKINDQYIEDIIKIRSLNKLNEYIFYSFNPGSWVNEKNFNEVEFKNWMKNNMPEHIPVTFAHVKKID
jgi:hypothetical protein